MIQLPLSADGARAGWLGDGAAAATGACFAGGAMFQAACGAGVALTWEAPAFAGLALAGLVFEELTLGGFAAAVATGVVLAGVGFTGAIYVWAPGAGVALAGALFAEGTSFRVSRMTGAGLDGAVIGASLRSGGALAPGMRAGPAVAVVQAGSGCAGIGRAGAASIRSGLKLEYRIGGTTVHSPLGDALRAVTGAIRLGCGA